MLHYCIYLIKCCPQMNAAHESYICTRCAVLLIWDQFLQGFSVLVDPTVLMFCFWCIVFKNRPSEKVWGEGGKRIAQGKYALKNSYTG